jgi:hypothetical protein
MLFSSRAQSGQIETELILDRSGDGGIIIEHHRNTYDVAPGALFPQMSCVETHLISLRVISLRAAQRRAHMSDLLQPLKHALNTRLFATSRQVATC